jgi:ribonuclease HI
MLRLYTDGSCSKNGRANSRGGYAVVYPDHLAESWGDILPTDAQQTNQTAELTGIHQGILRAKTLQGDPSHVQVRIYTDSEYSINCLTKWVAGWRKKGWKTSEGKPVVHKTLIEAITGELEAFGSHVFVHVKAHTGGLDEDSKWNAVADKLATDAVKEQKRIEYGGEVRPVHVQTEYVLPGIPLSLLGAPVAETELLESLKKNLGSLDEGALHSALLSALRKTLTARNYSLESSKIHKTNHFRLVTTTGIIVTHEE